MTKKSEKEIATERDTHTHTHTQTVKASASDIHADIAIGPKTHTHTHKKCRQTVRHISRVFQTYSAVLGVHMGKKERKHFRRISLKI